MSLSGRFFFFLLNYYPEISVSSGSQRKTGEERRVGIVSRNGGQSRGIRKHFFSVSSRLVVGVGVSKVFRGEVSRRFSSSLKFRYHGFGKHCEFT